MLSFFPHNPTLKGGGWRKHYSLKRGTKGCITSKTWFKRHYRKRDIKRDWQRYGFRVMKECPEHVSDVTGGSHRSDGQQLIISVLPRHFPRCCSTAEAPHHHSLHIRTESERWIAGKSERERELPHSMTQP